MKTSPRYSYNNSKSADSSFWANHVQSTHIKTARANFRNSTRSPRQLPSLPTTRLNSPLLAQSTLNYPPFAKYVAAAPATALAPLTTRPIMSPRNAPMSPRNAPMSPRDTQAESVAPLLGMAKGLSKSEAQTLVKKTETAINSRFSDD